MADSQNMICPNCQTFQPRADVCSKCGVIIAKVAKSAGDADSEEVIKSETGRPTAAKLAAIAIVIVLVSALAMFMKADKDAAKQPDGAIKPMDTVKAYDPALADNIQRNKVLARLHKLKTTLHMYLAQEVEPPSNEDGLRVLVSKGYLSQADITDEWGNIFEYKLEWGKETAFEKQYTIFVHSNGPDGISGNSDDVAMQ